MGKQRFRIVVGVLVVSAVLLPWFIEPFSSNPTQHSEGAFGNVTFHSCYDGDTCRFTIPGVHPLLGRRIGVRLAGIDTPEIKGKCAGESRLARKARAFLNRALRDAREIRLLNVRRGKYFRIVADIEADGVVINGQLIQQGLAHPYDGGRKMGWCG